MGNIQWILGVEPATLPVEWRECVKALFLQETGEVYADVSIASLPIPAWEGNLLLVDMDLYPAPESFKGLMWALPFLEEGVRITAFALQINRGKAGVHTHGIIWSRCVTIIRRSSFNLR